MRNKTIWIVLGAIVVAIVAIVALQQTRQPKEEKVIKIGAILPLTGDLAYLGKPELEALRIATEEINRMGQVKVSLVVEDSKGSAKEAASAAQKLASVEKVSLGLVSTSVAANAAAPIFDSASLPIITICSDDTIPQKYSHAVNIYVNLSNEQKVMSQYLLREGITRISVIRVNAQFSERGLRLLRELSGGKLQIVNDMVYELSSRDFKNIVTKVARDESEAVCIMGYGVEFPALMKTIRELGMNKPLFGNYTFLTDAARIEGVNMLLGVKFVAFPITPKDLMNSNFGREMRRVLGTTPGPFMDYVLVYESVMAWHDALSSGVSPQQFSTYIRGRHIKSILGDVTINAAGNAVIPMTIAAYSATGEIEIIWRERNE